MNKEDLKEVETLHIRPFTRFCMSIGAVPSSYLAGLTIEEQLLWLCSYLEKEVIPAVNNNGEAVSELQDLFVELKNYVDNYFDNLDVQEEINNKLDEMAESGELEEIISAYLTTRALICFDTVALMKESDNLISGCFVKTLGYYEKNDEGGATYKIRTKTEQDVVDEGNLILLSDETLVAELIIVNDSVNVKQFGAKGDNETDDTLSIQNALNSRATTIIFNNGTYLSNSLLLNKVKNYHLKGTGDCTIVNTLVDFEDSVENRNNCLIESYGFYEDKTMRDFCYIENINFNGGADNVAHVESHESASNNFGLCLWLTCFTNVQINNCHFYKTIKNAITTAYCQNVEIKNNYFEKIGYNLPIVTAKNSITCQNSMYNHISATFLYLHDTNVIIKDNYAKEIYNEFFANYSMQNVEIYNNICEKIGQYFIENLVGSDMGAYSGNINVYNNKIYGLTSQFINMNQSYTPTKQYNINIKNNSVYDLGIIQLPDDETIEQYQPAFIYRGGSNANYIYNIYCEDNKVDLKTSNSKTIPFAFIKTTNVALFSNNIINMSNTGSSTISQNYVMILSCNISKLLNNTITIDNTNLTCDCGFYINGTNKNDFLGNIFNGTFSNTIQLALTNSLLKFSNNFIASATQSAIKTTGSNCVTNFIVTDNYATSPYLVSVKSGDTIATCIVTSNFLDGNNLIKDSDSVITNKVNENNVLI